MSISELLRNAEGFEWDDGNDKKNVASHRVSCTEAEEVFFNRPLFVIDDEKHSEKEQRYHALGHSNEGRKLSLSFTIRGNKIRVISARDMSRKERLRYEQD